MCYYASCHTSFSSGRGAIGRGLLAQLWQEAGYETVFVDTDPALIDALNAQKSYTLRLVDNESEQTLTINNFQALHASDTKAITQALASSAFAATSVGYDNLTAVGPVLAQGLVFRENSSCLNVLVCENGLAPEQLLSAAAGDDEQRNICCLPTIVDRMVPQKCSNISVTLSTEPHGKLSFAGHWQGSTFPPTTATAIPLSKWPGETAKKLYLHNGGHFLVACLGQLHSHTTIANAVMDPMIHAELRGFWEEACAALMMEYNLEEFAAYTESLQNRFANHWIADTCTRVARNPERKLEPHERLRGAKQLCERFGIETPFIDRAIAAAEALLPASAGRC